MHEVCPVWALVAKPPAAVELLPYRLEQDGDVCKALVVLHDLLGLATCAMTHLQTWLATLWSVCFLWTWLISSGDTSERCHILTSNILFLEWFSHLHFLPLL